MNITTKVIQTVLGAIKPDRLGYCQCHEHLFIGKGQSYKVNPALWMDDLENAIDELKSYKEAGGNSLVDAQPLGCGRMESELIEASMKTGINIIASTGFHKLIFYPDEHWIHTIMKEELSQIFINELRSGMYVNSDYKYPKERTNGKAGIIKTAADKDGIMGAYKKLFLSAAIASKETGAPILCHTEMGKAALEIVDFLIGQGVRKDLIIICHIDRDVSEPLYHRAVADRGVYLEYDTIGRYKYHTDEQEAVLIKRMIDWGFEDQILLGLDTTRNRLISYGGNMGLTYIIESFIPLLMSHGVTEKYIQKLMYENPAKALAQNR
ncbi:MAG: phosphotriesterase family protein [Mahellales bacterium]|jgi:predicted metal-dependent phosphotriesterase family hydrolase